MRRRALIHKRREGQNTVNGAEKMRVLYTSSTSACLETDCTNPYYCDCAYDVFLNEKLALKRVKENVFSLFSLSPDTDYTVRVGEETVKFRTKAETAAINVKENGATGDGVTLDTIAIQTCIDVCPVGGRVFIPKGTYLISPITLKSGITLELDENATLIGSTDINRYDLLPAIVVDESGKEYPYSSFEGENVPCYKSLINAYGAEDFAVIGKGLIDGDAQHGEWWGEMRKDKTKRRPRLLFINNCKNANFHGVRFANSPSWSLHPYFSQNVGFYAVSVTAPPDSCNTDGMDPESCDGLIVAGCVFSTGDDCIAIKAGKIVAAEKFKKPANGYVIRNCLMQNGHGGVVLGSEMSAGVKNLTVTRCLFEGTDRGLRIKTRRGRGKDGIIDAIVFENIKMRGVKTPLVINMFYNCDSGGHGEYFRTRTPQPIDDGTPYIGELTFRNMDCEDCEYAAAYFDGLPERPIKSVTLENIGFSYSDNAEEGYPAMQSDVKKYKAAGIYADNLSLLKLKNVSFKKVSGEEVIIKNCKVIKED